MGPTRKQVAKEVAQDNLMQVLGIAFQYLEDGQMAEDMKKDVREAMDQQMARIEKLFGYEKNSWPRGI